MADINIEDNTIRGGVDRLIDLLEMHNFNQGFEAALNGLDELSNQKHNEGDPVAAEVLRWAVKEMKGEADEEFSGQDL